MNIEFIKDKKLTYFILILYIFYGLDKIFYNNPIDHSYMIISFFMFFKIIMNYYQCTISYIECKMRNVKKEEGYLFNFLNNFIQLRNERFFPLLLIYYVYINYYYFILTKYY